MKSSKLYQNIKKLQIRDLKNNLMIKDAYDKLLIATGTYAKTNTGRW